MNFDNIPLIFRTYRQWLVCALLPVVDQRWKTDPEFARGSKRPLTVVNGVVRAASVTDRSCFLSYEEARSVCEERGYAMGFVLTDDDPFTCIDFDIRDKRTDPGTPDVWTTPEQFDVYYRILDALDTYTEFSRSGKGYHAWVLGDIGAGRRRDGVEIYSRERFMIFTGRVVNAKDVCDRQAVLDAVVSEMRREEESVSMSEVDQTEDDHTVINRAARAENGEKFKALWMGNWSELGYPSQSEADLSMLSILAFYSKSNEQCRRIFWQCALGKRKKATEAYLNRTLLVVRDRQSREEKNLESESALVEAELARIQGEAIKESRSAIPLHVVGKGEPVASAAPMEAVIASSAPEVVVIDDDVNAIDWPPGLCGNIAKYIYNSSPRPVKEVSIVAALGILAGLCGKAWHIPQSGLNMYIILVAKSAVGKEAMHSGIASLISACSEKFPPFANFVTFDEFASGQALTKACVKNNSFLHVSGEWGRRLQRMSRDDRDASMASLRTVMTNLYQKSGPQSVIGGIVYSDKDKNVTSVNGVAYSMIGETTPQTFYDALSPSMIEDGFLSRFLIIEYNGLRPEMNRNQTLIPDAPLRESLVKLASQASVLIGAKKSQPVGRTEAAAELLNQFETECDKQINLTNDESRRQMWNRACLKVLRLSALLAVSDNWINPVISAAHVEWALTVVKKDIFSMISKVKDGDIGSDDRSRIKKLLSLIRGYFVSKDKSICEEFRSVGIIPRQYLQVRTSRVSCFYKHPTGATISLEQTLSNFVANGYIVEMQKQTMIEKYDYRGKAYKILQIPNAAKPIKFYKFPTTGLMSYN